MDGTCLGNVHCGLTPPALGAQVRDKMFSPWQAWSRKMASAYAERGPKGTGLRLVKARAAPGRQNMPNWAVPSPIGFAHYERQRR